ncbi:hypothetical protein GCM10011588_50900 [Nocardia jinanensis]|uniref:Uncharacterized protein n=1 Tax=Nocardia jinanensis TaxID=382504 RepID=A0A917RTF0_9NOCA|nr:hypothetical protein GCM10011588_50900 [Nocardia jinanensis]
MVRELRELGNARGRDSAGQPEFRVVADPRGLHLAGVLREFGPLRRRRVGIPAGDRRCDPPASRFGQHTNIVLTADNGTLTTIGGNEGDTVGIERWNPTAVPDIHIVGYGRLEPGW